VLITKKITGGSVNIPQRHCDVLQLDSGVDYRQLAVSTAGNVFITPNTINANRKLVEVFEDVAHEQGIGTSILWVPLVSLVFSQ
jgi:predicted ATPase